MFLNTLCTQSLNCVCVLKIGQFSLIINLFGPAFYLTAVAIDRSVEILSVRKEDGRKQ